MITRYNANFVDHMMEPSDEGRWVKFAEHEQTELLVDIKVEELVSEKLKAERAELQEKSAQVTSLTTTNEQLGGELEELRTHSGSTIIRQNALIEAAQNRLKLLGHAPTCDSRYGTIAVDGRKEANPCSCGLSEWMKESGLG